MPRGTHAFSTLIAPGFETLDGGSLAGQYGQIVKQGAFLFRPDSPRPRILDCGANVGVFTVDCSRRFPGAEITSFEPDPAVFAVLGRNVARCCDPASRIDLVQAAVVGDDSPYVEFFADQCDAGRLGVRHASGEAMRVKAVRLRDLLESKCDLLKIDIEGAEIDVLNDCADRLGNVRNLFVEYHSFVGRPQRLDELVGTLARGGFRLSVRSGMISPHPFLDREAFLDMDGQLEIWCTRD